MLERNIPEDYPSDIVSPIFPLISRTPKLLEEFLRPLGYAVTAIPYPTVPRGKEQIRVVLHAGNLGRGPDDRSRWLLGRVLLGTCIVNADRGAS